MIKSCLRLLVFSMVLLCALPSAASSYRAFRTGTCTVTYKGGPVMDKVDCSVNISPNNLDSHGEDRIDVNIKGRGYAAGIDWSGASFTGSRAISYYSAAVSGSMNENKLSGTLTLTFGAVGSSEWIPVKTGDVVVIEFHCP